MENKNKMLVTDGDTFVNRWICFKELDNIDIYMSASNYLLADHLFSISLDYLKDKPEQLKEFVKDHETIGFLFGDKKINKEIDKYLKNKDTFMRPIKLDTPDNKNINLVLFKGLALVREECKDAEVYINETVAFLQMNKNNNKMPHFFTINDEIINFCKKHLFIFNTTDLRIKGIDI